MFVTSSKYSQILIALLLFSPVSIFYFYGHDLQRADQVLIGLVAVLPWIKACSEGRATCIASRSVKLLLLMILLLGCVSSLQSKIPAWAFCEMSLLLLCGNLSFYVAAARRHSGERIDHLFLTFVYMICAVKVLQFGISTAAAFASDATLLNTDILLEGFSNKRFYGQFQTFTLPLLAFPLLYACKPKIKVAAFALLSCWWMIAISGGTRGTWLGLGVAVAVLALCGPFGRRWASWQIVATVVGGLLFWCLFSVLPSYLGIQILNFAGDRLTTTLSAREVIWQQAWEMIKERPFLGFGPMHFADIPNPIAAHPHQAILQWVSEWGVPSALLVGWLAFRGLTATLMLIRRKALSSEPVDLLRICLFASLVGALAQSMVDGVIVMPYSQLWLCVVIGWLLAIHEWKVQPTPMSPLMARAWLTIMASSILFLGYVVVRDLPHLEESQERYARDFGGHFKPRFWEQGVIATKPQ